MSIEVRLAGDGAKRLVVDRRNTLAELAEIVETAFKEHVKPGAFEICTKGGVVLADENYSELARPGATLLLVADDEKDGSSGAKQTQQLDYTTTPTSWDSSSMVTLQTAALPEKMTPLVAQEFTFPNLSSPLSGLPSDDFSMALTPSSSQIFTVPSIPASPLLVSSSTSAPLVVTTMTSTMMTTATATGAHPPPPSPPPPPSASKNEQESLFPEQATLSEKLTFMKYIEENPDSPTTFVELMQQIGPGSRYAVAKRAPSRPRLGLVHRSDSFSADVQSKLKQHLKRRKSEADVVASKATPPLLLELIGHQTASKRVKVYGDVDERPGPPPSLIPVDVVESKEDGRLSAQMSSLDHRLSVSSVSSTEERRKEMKRFPSSGTLSEKLAYLKWRESCADDDDDDVDVDDDDGGDVESSSLSAAATTVTAATASTKTAVASELVRGETKCKVDIQRGRLPNTFHFTWSQSVNHK